MGASRRDRSRRRRPPMKACRCTVAEWARIQTADQSFDALMIPDTRRFSDGTFLRCRTRPS
jgi:hypothetical protein